MFLFLLFSLCSSKKRHHYNSSKKRGSGNSSGDISLSAIIIISVFSVVFISIFVSLILCFIAPRCCYKCCPCYTRCPCWKESRIDAEEEEEEKEDGVVLPKTTAVFYGTPAPADGQGAQMPPDAITNPYSQQQMQMQQNQAQENANNLQPQIPLSHNVEGNEVQHQVASPYDV